jgi:hypothetical protein
MQLTILSMSKDSSNGPCESVLIVIASPNVTGCFSEGDQPWMARKHLRKLRTSQKQMIASEQDGTEEIALN